MVGKELKDVRGISAKSAELFAAAGYRYVQDVVKEDPESLAKELVKANSAFAIVNSNLTESLVRRWITAASKYHVGTLGEVGKSEKKKTKAEPQSDEVKLVDYEK